jgi:hypothetical protein
MTSADERQEQLVRILRGNDWFIHILRVARPVVPPDWAVGSGVIRNIVWDHLHGYATPTPVKDVDLVFFDQADLSTEREQAIEAELRRLEPDVPWEVKNQAAVHLWYEARFGHPLPPLRSLHDAIGTWPETAVAIGVRLLSNDALRVIAPCGLEDLLEMTLRRNPRLVTAAFFRRRVKEKRIEKLWPRVRVVYD